MTKALCEKHGEQDETFVCQHIVQGLQEDSPYGSWWADEVLEMAKVKLLCGACYDQAKSMNATDE